MTSAQRTATEEALGAMRVALISLAAYLRPGLREIDAAHFLHAVLRAQKFSQLAFHIIIAAGPAAYDFHHRPSQRRMKNGDMIVVDFGVRHRGWCMDLTRTFVLGAPSLQIRKRYRLVFEAQRRALLAVRAGVSGHDVDYAARSVFTRHGVEAAFRHTTGHGVGRKIHQDPRLASGNAHTLRNGDIITIEPGVYFRGWGGIRIEDMVEVTSRGPRVLTAAFPKDLHSMVIARSL